jgi:hypothetical protein
MPDVCTTAGEEWITFADPLAAHQFAPGDVLNEGRIVVLVDRAGCRMLVHRATWWRRLRYRLASHWRAAWWRVKCWRADARDSLARVFRGP